MYFFFYSGYGPEIVLLLLQQIFGIYIFFYSGGWSRSTSFTPADRRDGRFLFYFGNHDPEVLLGTRTTRRAGEPAEVFGDCLGDFGHENYFFV